MLAWDFHTIFFNPHGKGKIRGLFWIIRYHIIFITQTVKYSIPSLYPIRCSALFFGSILALQRSTNRRFGNENNINNKRTTRVTGHENKLYFIRALTILINPKNTIKMHMCGLRSIMAHRHNEWVVCLFRCLELTGKQNANNLRFFYWRRIQKIPRHSDSLNHRNRKTHWLIDIFS